MPFEKIKKSLNVKKNMKTLKIFFRNLFLFYFYSFVWWLIFFLSFHFFYSNYNLLPQRKTSSSSCFFFFIILNKMREFLNNNFFMFLNLLCCVLCFVCVWRLIWLFCVINMRAPITRAKREIFLNLVSQLNPFVW